MTVGVPGTGIGGIFYVVTALAMPLREVGHALRRRRDDGAPPPRWGVAFRQAALALGILAGIGVTGWLLIHLVPGLAEAVARDAAGSGADAGPARNLVRVGAFVLSLATLTGVVGVVEVVSLWRGRRALLVAFALMAVPHAALGQMERADSAFEAEDRALAERLYAEVLAADPWNSRATYRLAVLRRDRPEEALRLFRRYAELEPDDPWGFLAVADQLADMGRTDDAIAAYGAWLAQAPGDLEALEGRAAQLRRAGRLREALGDLERAQAADPTGARDRRMRWWGHERAPGMSPGVAVSRDSDGNVVSRVQARGDAALGGRGRWGALVAHTRASDGVSVSSALETALTVAWRPRAALRVEGWGGASFLDADGARATLPVGDVRLRWRTPDGRGGLDARAQRILLAASPALVAAEAVRSEASLRADLPLLGRLAARAGARRGAVSTTLGDNRRTVVQGGPVAHVLPAGEVSLQLLDLRYAHPTTAPYFAPRVAQVAELGTYMEREGDGPWLLVLDAGAGLQRVARHGEGFSGWTPTARLDASATWTPRGGSWLLFGVEAYDSRLEQLTGSSAAWRFLSVRAAARLAAH